MARAGLGHSRTVLFVVLVTLGFSGCSRVRHHFSGGTPTRHGVLTVTPASGAAGSTFTLVASGFLPGEAMTFEIDIKGQPPFVGPHHAAGPDGKVTTQYTPQPGNPAGAYTVKAVGAGGTRATGKLTVLPGGSQTSTTT